MTTQPQPHAEPCVALQLALKDIELLRKEQDQMRDTISTIFRKLDDIWKVSLGILASFTASLVVGIILYLLRKGP